MSVYSVHLLYIYIYISIYKHLHVYILETYVMFIIIYNKKYNNIYKLYTCKYFQIYTVYVCIYIDIIKKQYTYIYHVNKTFILDVINRLTALV